MPVIPALGRLRQECEFEGYIDPVSKNGREGRKGRRGWREE
jgi:hypothetical protein